MPIFSAMRLSNSSTLPPSPSNSSMKLTCVPVAPRLPKSFSDDSAKLTSSKSITRSCIHSVARFPTVVSCAGCRWV